MRTIEKEYLKKEFINAFKVGIFLSTMFFILLIGYTTFNLYYFVLVSVLLFILWELIIIIVLFLFYHFKYYPDYVKLKLGEYEM